MQGKSASLKTRIRALFPKRIRPYRILAGPLRGSWIVTSWHDYPSAIIGRTERPLLNWFDQNVRQGETWLDIGAHYGYTAIALCLKVGKSGRVFAFEPIPSTAGCLDRTRTLNRFYHLTILTLALAAPKDLELVDMFTTRGMADSGIEGGEFAGRLLTSRLDWLWPHIRGDRERIDGIKIDVQGMELDVIWGMSGILKSLHPKLVLEFHHNVERNDLLATLATVGYQTDGVPVESVQGEEAPLYLDDKNYVFT